MENKDLNLTTHRRGFIGSLATGAMALSLGSLAAPLQSMAKEKPGNTADDDPDEWFKKIKGKHRIVFDVTEPKQVFPFAWPRVFMMTNQMTGTPEKDQSVVVILRHNAMPFALQDNMWTKYGLGEMFKVNDMATNTAYSHNPFWQPKAGTYKFPGVGPVAIGINELQESGVMFCVCNVAMTVYSAAIGEKMNMNAADVLNDFKAALLPGIQVVPSGVWAVGRAQEHGCAYCYVG